MGSNNDLYVVAEGQVKGPFPLAKLKDFLKRKGPDFDIEVSSQPDGTGATSLSKLICKKNHVKIQQEPSHDEYPSIVKELCASFVREARQTISEWNSIAQKRSLLVERSSLGDRHLKVSTIPVPKIQPVDVTKPILKPQKVSFRR